MFTANSSRLSTNLILTHLCQWFVQTFQALLAEPVALGPVAPLKPLGGPLGTPGPVAYWRSYLTTSLGSPNPRLETNKKHLVLWFSYNSFYLNYPDFKLFLSCAFNFAPNDNIIICLFLHIFFKTDTKTVCIICSCFCCIFVIFLLHTLRPHCQNTGCSFCASAKRLWLINYAKNKTQKLWGAGELNHEN